MTHIQCILVVLCSLCSTGTFAALEVISGNCISSSGGTCVASPNYATGDYPTYQPCTIENTVAGCISSEAFVTESTFDTLNVRRRGSTYSGSTSFSDVWLDNGDMIQWELDSSMQETGWKFCTSTCVNGVGPAPTGAPTLGTTDLSIVTGDCTLSDGGTCASSPNYPSNYANSQTCNISNNVDGYISSQAFSTESMDSVSMRRRGGSYSGTGRTVIASVYLESGDTIEWESDESVTNSGWKICHSVSESAADHCCDLGSSACYTYTGECGALSDKTSCWQTFADIDYCYAQGEGDCCDVNGGAVAGICIGVFVFVAGAVAACCFLCSSCPLAKSMNKTAVQPVVVLQRQPVQQQPVMIVQQQAPPPPPIATQAVPIAAQPFAMVAHPVSTHQGSLPQNPSVSYQPTQGAPPPYSAQ